MDYEKAESLWRDRWSELVRQLGETDLWRTPWFKNKFADGSPMLDGNPIFSAVCPSRRIGVRVIQRKPDDSHPISSWTDTFDEGENAIDELVVCGSLAEMNDGIEIIRVWITSQKNKPSPSNRT